MEFAGENAVFVGIVENSSSVEKVFFKNVAQCVTFSDSPVRIPRNSKIAQCRGILHRGRLCLH